MFVDPITLATTTQPLLTTIITTAVTVVSVVITFLVGYHNIYAPFSERLLKLEEFRGNENAQNGQVTNTLEKIFGHVEEIRRDVVDQRLEAKAVQTVLYGPDGRNGLRSRIVTLENMNNNNHDRIARLEADKDDD